MDGRKYDPKFEKLLEAMQYSNFIVVNGLPSVGKTSMVKYVFSLVPEYCESYIDCTSTISLGHLYNTIISDLSISSSKKRDNSSKVKKIVGVADLVRTVSSLLVEANHEKMFVILDHIELFDRGPMCSCLNVLAQIPGLNIVIVSNESARSIIDNYCKLSLKHSLKLRLVNIVLKAWSKDELIEEICRFPPKVEQELYKKFVHNVVQTVYRDSTRDFIELRCYCQENFEDFLTFFEQKKLDYIRKMEPEAKDMSDEELLEYDFELTTSVQGKIMLQYLTTLSNSCSQRVEDTISSTDFNLDKRVVLNTSILIISAYIAANTKPSDDKLNFVRFQKRKARRERIFEEASRTFTLERLLQIHKSLSFILISSSDKLSENNDDQKEQDPSDAVLTDIKALEDLKILLIYSGDGFDTTTRYQISNDLNRDYVKRLAAQVGLDLENFYGMS